MYVRTLHNLSNFEIGCHYPHSHQTRKKNILWFFFILFQQTMQNSLHQKQKSLKDIFDDFFLKVPLHLKSRTLIFSWKGKPLVLKKVRNFLCTFYWFSIKKQKKSEVIFNFVEMPYLVRETTLCTFSNIGFNALFIGL